jgi:hypothetical protein
MKDNRLLVILGLASSIVIALIFVLPVVGFIATIVLLSMVPPWGRGYIERFAISAMVVLALIALVFPRASSMPINSMSAHVTLVVIVLGALALRLVPKWRYAPVSRPTLVEGMLLGLFTGTAGWIIGSYAGRNTYETVSGLYFSGWDNQGHFTAFANTYVQGSSSWTTVDGSEAWNQWYPSLHSTLWALSEHAVNAAELTRIDLLWPFVIWTAVTFAMCMMFLSWIAGDLASRISGKKYSRQAAVLAVFATGMFTLLGSPALFFNAGFTNFVLGVTVVATASYLSARSMRSAAMLGWFVLPAAAVAVINLWTPMVIGLLPAGVVVLIALWKVKPARAIIWILGSGVIAVVLAFQQVQAIIRPGSTAGDLSSDIGAVATGMVPFNIALGIAAPFLALLVIVLLWRRNTSLSIAISAPAIMFAVLAITFIPGTDVAEVSRVSSYYVLKALSAAMLAFTPIVIALAAALTMRAVQDASRTKQLGVMTLAGGIGVCAYGYFGVTPTQMSDGFTFAPGIQAANARMYGIENPLVGEAIIRAANTAGTSPEYTPFLFDGAGTLVNVWVSSLTGVTSVNQRNFYEGLPPFPYDNKALDYVDFAMRIDPSLKVNALWFRGVSGDLITPWARGQDPTRVMSTQVPMPSNAMCEDCRL